MTMTRRILLPAIVATLACGAARADPFVEDVLDGATSYFGAAGDMMSGLANRLGALTPKGMSGSKRKAIAADMDALNDALSSLSMRQGMLIADIGAYIESVRARGFIETEHPSMWRQAVSGMDLVLDQVLAVQKHQQQASWMKTKLSAAQEQALADVLSARISLLQRLRDLPAPRTPVEIDKLAAMHKRYQELAQKLWDLRTVLLEARRRFDA